MQHNEQRKTSFYCSCVSSQVGTGCVALRIVARLAHMSGVPWGWGLTGVVWLGQGKSRQHGFSPLVFYPCTLVQACSHDGDEGTRA